MIEYRYKGKTYTRPDREPPENRDLGGLHLVFSYPLRAYLERANAILTHVSVLPGECFRTVERQAYLYAKGRDPKLIDAGFKNQVTWTLESRHLTGLACDLFMIRKSNKQLIWDETSWQWLYKVIPPEQYGLANIAPAEYAHIEHAAADALIAKGIVRREFA